MSSYREQSEEVLTCPYNKAHRIMRKRLQRHLIRCRESHPDVEIVRCPFNSVHQVPEPELHHHVSICPDKASIDQYRFNVSAGKVKVESSEVSKQPDVNCDDDWDEVNVGTYDPKKYVKNAKNIIKSKTEEDLDENDYDDGEVPAKKKKRNMTVDLDQPE